MNTKENVLCEERKGEKKRESQRCTNNNGVKLNGRAVALAAALPKNVSERGAKV